MNPEEPINSIPTSTNSNQKKIIQPINPEEVKAYGEQNNPVTPVNLASVQSYHQPQTPQTAANEKTEIPKEEEWKPNTTLSSRIPALRNYGIVLLFGSLLFMYINRSIWKFSHQSSAKMLGIIIYAFLGVMLITGAILLLSKSKTFVQLCLNIIIGLAILLALFSVLSINITVIIFSIVIVGSVINIKQYVKKAA